MYSVQGVRIFGILCAHVVSMVCDPLELSWEAFLKLMH